MTGGAGEKMLVIHEAHEGYTDANYIEVQAW